MACQLASWLPDAVAATLRDQRSAEPIIAWLNNLRASVEEYDPLITVRPSSPDSESETSTSPDSAFDEILSQLGKEIYHLDEYQRNLVAAQEEVSLSILNIFDKCLEGMTDVESKQDVSEVKPVNGLEECSECESTLSDVSFVTSTPRSEVKSDINGIFDKGRGPPVPPRRTRLKTPSTSSSIYDNMDLKTEATIMEVAKRLESESDSESTCWSYKECSDAEIESKDAYAAVWSHSTGFHNSDEILRKVLSQHHATISRISFDTASDFSPTQYPVYSLHEHDRDRCEASTPVAAMTPGKPLDDADGYEPVRDAITTDENIYEEIEYGYSYTDEGCSCDSIEVESCSISACSDRESPFYTNLRDNDAYAIPSSVIYWKNLLLHPFYNDDEEDEVSWRHVCIVRSQSCIFNCFLYMVL